MAGSSYGILRVSFAAVLAWVSLTGCVVHEAAPVPAPRQSLTITGQRRQTQAEQDRDNAQCQSQASAQAGSSQGWIEIFTACMSGRGYLVR